MTEIFNDILKKHPEVEVILGVGIIISFAIVYAIDYFKKK